MAQDPSRAAGAIQEVGKETARIVGTAQAQAETSELIKEASAEKQRVEELIPREQAEMERKQARKRAKFDFARDMLQNVGQFVAAARPQTREAKLGSQEARGAKKASRLGASKERAIGREATDTRVGKITLREQKALAKSEAAGAELDALARAKVARWRSYNPLPSGQSAKKHPSVYIEDLRTKSPYTVDQPWKTEK